MQSVDKYAILKKDTHLLVMIKGYQPYTDCTLDSYYLTSNQLYKLAKQMVDILQQNGGQARIPNELSFRSLVYESGLASIKGINSMAMNERLGSYFCINVVSTNVDISELGNVSNGQCQPELCIDCQICVHNCPNNAIGSDGSFDASRCIRAYMEGQELTQDMFDKIGNRFLGCDDCQSICPHNNHIDRQPASENIKNLVDNALYDCPSLAPILGSNYARPKIVFNNAIIVAGNRKDKKHLARIQELSQDPRFSHNAQMAIQKITHPKE